MPTKRRYRKRRSRKRKSTLLTRVMRNYQVHNFKRYYDAAQITNLTTFFALEFRLNLLPSSTEFAVLFDQYRILRCELTFVPKFNTADIANTTGIPYMLILNDFDDSTIPTTEAEMLEQNATIYRLDKMRRWVCNYPRITEEVQSTAGTGAKLGKGAQWLDMGDTDIIHYGTKAGIFNNSSNNIVDVYCCVYFQCKGLR